MVHIKCPLCVRATRAYLALLPPGCDGNVLDGALPATRRERTASGPLLTDPGDDVFWRLRVDTQALVYGGVYAFCVDPDGAALDFGFADTGKRVSVSPIVAVSPTAIPATQPNVVLTVECQARTCSSASQAYVAYECDDTLRLGSLAAVRGSSSPSGAFERVPNLRLSPPAHNRQQVHETETWTIKLSLTGFAPGRPLALCVDVDGRLPNFGMGNAGFEINIQGLV